MCAGDGPDFGYCFQMSEFLLDELLDPLARTFSEQQARKILSWELSSELKIRMDHLRTGANEGTLSAEEDEEYKRLVEELDTIALIQLKARRAPALAAA